MRLYWGSNRQLNHFQLPQYAETLCKLNEAQALTPGTSQCERPRTRHTRNIRDTVASVTKPRECGRPSRDEGEINSSTDSQKSADNDRYCRVCLSRKHLMKKCPFAKQPSTLVERLQTNLDLHGRNIFKWNSQRLLEAQRDEKRSKESPGTYCHRHQLSSRPASVWFETTLKKAVALDAKA